VIDPAIGASLWWSKEDALMVARYRTTLCRIEQATAQVGDVVSALGARDTRIFAG